MSNILRKSIEAWLSFFIATVRTVDASKLLATVNITNITPHEFGDITITLDPIIDGDIGTVSKITFLCRHQDSIVTLRAARDWLVLTDYLPNITESDSVTPNAFSPIPVDSFDAEVEYVNVTDKWYIKKGGEYIPQTILNA